MAGDDAIKALTPPQREWGVGEFSRAVLMGGGLGRLLPVGKNGPNSHHSSQNQILYERKEIEES